MSCSRRVEVWVAREGRCPVQPHFLISGAEKSSLQTELHAHHWCSLELAKVLNNNTRKVTRLTAKDYKTSFRSRP